MSGELKEIGIAGYRVDRIEEHRYHSVLHLSLWENARPACPWCRPQGHRDERSEAGGLKVYTKGPYSRTVRHLDAFGRTTYLRVHTRRFQCRRCRKSFLPLLPGIKPYRHSSEPFRRKVYEQHRDGIAGSVLGSASVERFYHEYTERKARERFDGVCPPVLGIDEHSIHRKKTNSHRSTRFATTLCNLRTRHVFDTVQGRDPQSLDAYFIALKGKQNVRVACMD